MAKSSQGFIVVLPGEIIEIAQDDDISWLTLFYALPKELAEKYPDALKIPRCPYEVLYEGTYGAVAKSDMLKMLVWDCYSWAAWQFFKVKDRKGNYREIPGSRSHYAGFFPLWRLSYAIITYIRMKFEKCGLGFQNLYNMPRGVEVPWLTYQQFGNLVGNLTDIIVEEENWQPMIDAAREMRSPEDYDDKFSTVKNDFLRTWHHSRSAKPISLEEMMEDEDGNIYSVIRDIKKKIAALLDWLKEVKEELAKPQTPDLFALLQAYFNQRNAGAYSQRARVNNLKEYSELCQYLLDHGITDITTLEAHVSDLRATTDSLKKKLDTQTAELKLLRKIPEYFADYKRLKPVFDGFQKIKFSKAREKYRAEHAADLKRFYEARRIISQKFPDGKFDRKALEAEYAELEQQHDATYSEFKAIRAESQTLWKIKSHIDTARKNIEPIQINAPTQKQEKEI